MKTHFAELESGNEGYPYDEWSQTVCGLEYTESPLTNNWNEVSCKRCLQLKERYKKEMELAMKHSCRDMAEFVEFNK